MVFTLIGSAIARSVQSQRERERERAKASENQEETPSESREEKPAADSFSTPGVVKTAAPFATVRATDTMRRKGVDRHAEAGLAEKLHSNEHAAQAGYTVLEENTSVFSGDGGVDRTLATGSGTQTMQIKHTAQKIGDAILKQYSDVDVFASSSGFKENAEPAQYGMTGVTIDDWTVKSRVKLAFHRIKTGIELTAEQADDATNGLLGRLWSSVKSIGKRIFGGVVAKRGSITGVAKSVASWFFRLSLGKQILVATFGSISVVSAVYLVRRWLQNDGDDQATGYVTNGI